LQINKAWANNSEHRCAFVYGAGTITLILFKDTDNMLAEVADLEKGSLQLGMSLDVHFQD
jgi:hypothetical protein